MAFVFDTETNGLSENRSIKLERQPHLIEFYGCLVDLAHGKILFDYETLVKPPKLIEQEIADITSINNNMLKDAPSFAEVADKIISSIEAAPLVIAHNASFDKEIIDIEANRLGRIVNWPRVLCTVEQTIHLQGKRLTLTNLHQHLFNEKFADAHRAKVDTRALVRCCVELVKRGEL